MDWSVTSSALSLNSPPRFEHLGCSRNIHVLVATVVATSLASIADAGRSQPKPTATSRGQPAAAAAVATAALVAAAVGASAVAAFAISIFPEQGGAALHTTSNFCRPHSADEARHLFPVATVTVHSRQLVM